jgi:hypothetical protein
MSQGDLHGSMVNRFKKSWAQFFVDAECRFDDLMICPESASNSWPIAFSSISFLSFFFVFSKFRAFVILFPVPAVKV